MKRTLSIIAAIMLTFTMVNFVPEGTVSASAENNTTVTAENSNGSVTLDEATGVLTLKGHFTKDELWEYRTNDKVTSIVAEEGCVFPEDCSDLFASDGGSTSVMGSGSWLFFDNVTSIDISKSDTSNVKDMSYMFCRYRTHNYYSSVDNYETKYERTSKLVSINVSGIDTSNVENFEGMFYCCEHVKDIDVSSFDTSSALDMYRMFAECKSLTSLDVSNFKTSKIWNMSSMFLGCSSLTELDLSSFDTSYTSQRDCPYLFPYDGYTPLMYLFYDCSSLKSIYVSGNWKVVEKYYTKCMFEGCTALVGDNGTKYDEDHIDGEYARIDKEGEPGYFTAKEDVKDSSVTLNEETGVLTLRGDITKEEVLAFKDNEKVTSVVAEEGCVFPENCGGLFFFDYSSETSNNIESIDISKADTSKVKFMSEMFRGCTKLKSLDLSGLDTSNVQTMDFMFADCDNLTSLNISNFDTSNVLYMGGMFYGCRSLESLDLSSFDTSSVDNSRNDFDFDGVKYMFTGCESLKTIYVSEGWKLKENTASDSMFSADDSTGSKTSLAFVGGNGTNWSADHVDGEYARIDKEGEPGYFTYKEYKASSVLGDVNGDDNIDIEDAVAVIGHINGNKALTGTKLKNADVDGNGSVDIEDAVAIIAHVNGVKSIG